MAIPVYAPGLIDAEGEARTVLSRSGAGRTLGAHAPIDNLGLEDDRDRPVVDELDLHARPEDTARDAHSLGLESGAEDFVERLGALWTRRAREARPVPLRGVLQTSDVNRRMEQT